MTGKNITRKSTAKSKETDAVHKLGIGMVEEGKLVSAVHYLRKEYKRITWKYRWCDDE